MTLTRKSLPRRTFLRGTGVALALPLLDAMVPAATALAKTPARPVRRIGYVFMPMGADMSRWTPKTEKSGDRLSDELSPILKSPSENAASRVFGTNSPPDSRSPSTKG